MDGRPNQTDGAVTLAGTRPCSRSSRGVRPSAQSWDPTRSLEGGDLGFLTAVFTPLFTPTHHTDS